MFIRVQLESNCGVKEQIKEGNQGMGWGLKQAHVRNWVIQDAEDRFLQVFCRFAPPPSSEVAQRFSSVLALRDGGRLSSGAVRAAPAPTQFFAVGRLLTFKRKVPDPKAFVLAEYDGLQDVASVPIESFLVWVDIKGLPDALWTEEAVEKVGLSLGFVEHLDKLGLKRGSRIRVRILHKLSDPVQEAFGDLPFEFGSIRFPVKLQVKYDRTVGFCRVCGMFVHQDSGCGGPPALTPQFIDIESMRTAFRYGGAARVSSNPNPPPPPKTQFFESSGDRKPAFRGVPVSISNPFAGSSGCEGGMDGPRVSFSLPGISAADLAVQLARFRAPMPAANLAVVPVSPVAPPKVIPEPARQVSPPLISGVKRGAEMELVVMGKRGRGEKAVMQFPAVPFDLPFSPEVVLAHLGGVLTVSPVKKRRVGRPKNSKNKVAAVASSPVEPKSGGPQRAKKRVFGARKATRAQVIAVIDGAASGEAVGVVFEPGSSPQALVACESSMLEGFGSCEASSSGVVAGGSASD
ncbi:hypothetical protein ACLB2K_035550 [Fragaria x ananassa]